jgi:regulator of protease activity HflC (stomatin/prohibitin superfamily)
MMFKLNPNERLLIENGINHYILLGPDIVLLFPWQKALAKLDVGPQERTLQFERVQTVENVPVKVTIEVCYQVGVDLLTDDLLSKLPGLSQGGWRDILQRRAEQVLRRMLAGYSWRELGQRTFQQRLEQELSQTLVDHLKGFGLKVTSVCLVQTELPDNLQNTIVQAEQDSLEPRGRALVLKEYAGIFGGPLSQAMPYIVQWELLSLLHKNGLPQLFLTSSDLSLGGRSANGRVPQSTFQMQLPVR